MAKATRAKPVHEISLDINQFLYDKDRGESLAALIVSLSMTVKRYSKDYEDYLERRKEAINRIMELTQLSEKEFLEESRFLSQVSEAA